MGAKKWKAILELGETLGLFRLDGEALSFPILVAIAPEPEVVGDVYDLEDLDGWEDEEEDEEEDAAPKSRNRDAWKTATHDVLSGGPSGPSMLECGHWKWYTDGETAKAREKGKCCAGWKSSVNWNVAGLSNPVPRSFRRSSEKDQGFGWPGLCCDSTTGLYIGGVGNDCRHSGKKRCETHSKRDGKGGRG
jgi:hypothetical protein